MLHWKAQRKIHMVLVVFGSWIPIRSRVLGWEGLASAIFKRSKGKKEKITLGRVQPPNHKQNLIPEEVQSHKCYHHSSIVLVSWKSTHPAPMTDRPETCRILEGRKASFICRSCCVWMEAPVKHPLVNKCEANTGQSLNKSPKELKRT